MDANQLRQAVVADLESADEPELAARIADPGSTRLPRLLELPGGAVAGLFEAFPHPSASFYAAVAAGQVFYLTNAPEIFSNMMHASGLQVADNQTAAEIARAYVETTRTFETYTAVLDSADDIRLQTGTAAAASQAVARVREAVRPPAAAAAGPGRYEVRLFVLRGDTVEHRMLTVTADGTVTERTEAVFPGLPVPITL